MYSAVVVALLSRTSTNSLPWDFIIPSPGGSCLSVDLRFSMYYHGWFMFCWTNGDSSHDALRLVAGCGGFLCGLVDPSPPSPGGAPRDEIRRVGSCRSCMTTVS